MSVVDLFDTDLEARASKLGIARSDQVAVMKQTLAGARVFSGLALQLAIKRLFDFVVALSALIVLSPLFLIVAILIKLDSVGPVFFSQVRYGKDCKRIRIYKFRSMRTDLCDASGVAQTVEGDPRITAMGAFLRKSNIDELPQLLNVLKGDMSLIGPRCHAVGMKAAGGLYEDLCPDYHERHIMRPGITGLAQMRGLRGPTVRRDKSRARVKCDIYYVRNFSLALDVKILIGTIRSELLGGSGF
jgi:polysaccharide biosynthesis protein PslA